MNNKNELFNSISFLWNTLNKHVSNDENNWIIDILNKIPSNHKIITKEKEFRPYWINFIIDSWNIEDIELYDFENNICYKDSFIVWQNSKNKWTDIFIHLVKEDFDKQVTKYYYLFWTKIEKEFNDEMSFWYSIISTKDSIWMNYSPSKTLFSKPLEIIIRNIYKEKDIWFDKINWFLENKNKFKTLYWFSQNKLDWLMKFEEFDNIWITQIKKIWIFVNWIDIFDSETSVISFLNNFNTYLTDKNTSKDDSIWSPDKEKLSYCSFYKTWILKDYQKFEKDNDFLSGTIFLESYLKTKLYWNDVLLVPNLDFFWNNEDLIYRYLISLKTKFEKDSFYNTFDNICKLSEIMGERYFSDFEKNTIFRVPFDIYILWEKTIISTIKWISPSVFNKLDIIFKNANSSFKNFINSLWKINFIKKPSFFWKEQGFVEYDFQQKIQFLENVLTKWIIDDRLFTNFKTQQLNFIKSWIRTIRDEKQKKNMIFYIKDLMTFFDWISLIWNSWKQSIIKFSNKSLDKEELELFNLISPFNNMSYKNRNSYIFSILNSYKNENFLKINTLKIINIIDYLWLKTIDKDILKEYFSNKDWKIYRIEFMFKFLNYVVFWQKGRFEQTEDNFINNFINILNILKNNDISTYWKIKMDLCNKSFDKEIYLNIIVEYVKKIIKDNFHIENVTNFVDFNIWNQEQFFYTLLKRYTF